MQAQPKEQIDQNLTKNDVLWGGNWELLFCMPWSLGCECKSILGRDLGKGWLRVLVVSPLSKVEKFSSGLGVWQWGWGLADRPEKKQMVCGTSVSCSNTRRTRDQQSKVASWPTRALLAPPFCSGKSAPLGVAHLKLFFLTR